MYTLRNALADATRHLHAAGVQTPAREARLLVAHVLGLVPQTLAEDTVLDACRREKLAALVARRARHEPMALILGSRGFWTLELEVSPVTLIPRPDSETLIEAALAAFPEKAAVQRVLDLGTGTGCLLLAALVEFPEAFGVGIDIAPGAAALAARNAAANGLADRAAFIAADWDAPLSGRMDLIVCNPPYIRSDDIARLMPDVRDYEPRRALDGGSDGLAAYERLLPMLPGRLAEGGVAILELGFGQADAVRRLAVQAGFQHVATRPDLAGVPRALVLAGC